MSILIIIVGISLLILVHELGHFLAAKFFNVKVEEFGFGFPPRIFAKKIGETRYSLNFLPFGGFVRLLGENSLSPIAESERSRSFSHQAAWRRAVIIVSGVLMNFLLGWLIISGLFLFGSSPRLGITAVLPNTPADQIGLREGDFILGFERAQDFINFVDKNKGKEIALNIQRGEEVLPFNVIPREKIMPSEGPLGIGVGEIGYPKLPFLQSLIAGFTTTLQITVAIFAAMFNLFIGLLAGSAALKNFVGPVGIFQVANETGALGLPFLFNLIALISLNLLVLNILPFPALDGGRLLFVLVEKIKGSPIAPRKESIANAIGFIILLLLMIGVTIKDIIYLF